MLFKKILAIVLMIISTSSSFILIDNNTSYEQIEENIIIEKEPRYKLLLEIPSLNLKTNIYKNNIDKGVSYLKNINIDETVILLAHSGNSKISYFKNLDKLKKDDKIIFHYNYKKYTYKVTKTYLVDQYNTKILNKKTSDTILLITCFKKNNTKRLIVEGIKI